MAASPSGSTRLVGDIGGTNTRLALFDPASGELSARRAYNNREHAGLEAIIAAWLDDLPGPVPAQCCLAVAAPPFRDRVRMLNIDWSFSASELAARFGFAQLRCINDFEGNAFALPHLGAAELHALRAGLDPDCRKLAVLGPGTGLGGATLEFCQQTPVACASEPGHMGLAAANELELALFAALLPRHGEVHAELLLSGPGLARLYRALAEVRGQPVQDLTPAQVSSAALAGESPLCAEAVAVFCALLGSAGGDYVLATGSYGGLYLAGGIVPRILPLLENSEFCARFQAKGDMAPHLARVPLFAVTSPDTGLIGAAHTPLG
ncbi:MAG: glucokinase [Halioglobus sp.]|nr:glucokinase [Halioglobus sp.]